MLSSALKEKLRDPVYLDRHLAAAAVVRDLTNVPWYDAHFLKRFATAKKYLAIVAPDKVEEFTAGFAPLQTPADFVPPIIDDLLDTETLEEIRSLARSIPEAALENHEMSDFGRHVVHDHARFSQLQRQLQPQIEQLLGRKLVSGYNFLSLYGSKGVCAPHLDEPFSMYTLDFCIEQSVEWPIYFSKIIDWSEPDAALKIPPEELPQHKELEFRPHVLRPNQALIFSGSGQWHYRDAIPQGGHCSLLFLHYYPQGADNLVRPHKWAEHFGWPELEPLCDMFGEVPNR